jgi:tripartite-type tricarboxylate transporter receptor subunit TctC
MKWLVAAVLALSPALASAQYPTKPVKLVVGFAPGGAADTVARAYSEYLSRNLGQPVVIENRAGAGSSIAAEVVAKAAPDGYTVLIASPASISVNPALNPKLGYKAADFAPITKVSASPLVLVVNPATNITSVKELVATAKRDPGKLNYATSGVGSAPHFGAVLFSQITGIKMEHVPFKGGAPAVVSVVKAGRLRALAVTQRQRSALMPDIPGMEEEGLPDYELSFWYGLFVPANTPPEIIWKLYEATAAAAQRPEVKAALAREGTEVSISKSPHDFAEFLEQDEKFWVKLVKDTGATGD